MKLNSDERELVVEECAPCSKVTEGGVCETYPSPKVKWARGKKCPLASHLRPKVTMEEEGKKRVRPQKQARKKKRN